MATTRDDQTRLTQMKIVGGVPTLIVYTVIALAVGFAIWYVKAPHHGLVLHH